MGDSRVRLLRLAAVIRDERDALRRVVQEAEQALETFRERPPTHLELRGLGGIVHDVYTGVEHLLEKIAPELNGGLPAGPAWHRDLLRSMTLDLPSVRPPVLRTETAEQLDDYLRFRHLFRNLYGFELDWEKVRPLLERLPRLWDAIQEDLERFLAFLDEAT